MFRCGHLGSAPCILLSTETHKDRVGHLDQDVIHTVDVHALHPPRLHLPEDVLLGVDQCLVQPSVPVRGSRQAVFLIQDDLGVVGEAGKHVLFEHHHVSGVQPKITVLLKEFQRGVFRVITGHDIPAR